MAIVQEQPPEYKVEELTFEQAVLLLATEEEKHKMDYSRASERLIETYAADTARPWYPVRKQR